jgi:hypothetical protein
MEQITFDYKVLAELKSLTVENFRHIAYDSIDAAKSCVADFFLLYELKPILCLGCLSGRKRQKCHSISSSFLFSSNIEKFP